MESVSLVFVLVKQGGCFAISDQLTSSVVLAASAVQGVTDVHLPIAYHFGVRLGFWRACLIVLTPVFFFCFAQLISVRCHLSLDITLAEPSFF